MSTVPKKQLLFIFGKSMISVLSSTIGIVPFLLFIWVNHHSATHSAFPFAVFYTCRLLGIFLIRGAQRTSSSQEWVALALLTGCTGSMLAGFGSFFPLLYSLSAVLLGLCASWLSSANATMQHFQPTPEIRTNRFLVICAFGLLFWSMSLSENLRIPLTFLCYSLFFLIALVSFLIRTHAFSTHSMSLRASKALVSKTDILIFIGTFICLILLRAGRLLSSQAYLTFALIGFSFLLIFYLFRTIRFIGQRKVPFPLYLLTFIHGAIGNFLILFGSLYILNIFGKSVETKLLYLPYILGIVLSMFTYKSTEKLVPAKQELLFSVYIAVGLAILLNQAWLAQGVFLISYGHSLLGRWLTKHYFSLSTIPEQQQLLVKKTTQNKGAIIQQFSLMLLLGELTLRQTRRFSLFAEILNPTMVNYETASIFDRVKLICFLLFVSLFALYMYLAYRKYQTPNKPTTSYVDD